MRRVAPNLVAMTYIAELRAGRGAPLRSTTSLTARSATAMPVALAAPPPTVCRSPAVLAGVPPAAAPLAAIRAAVPARKLLLWAAAAAAFMVVVGVCTLAFAQGVSTEEAPVPATVDAAPERPRRREPPTKGRLDGRRRGRGSLPIEAPPPPPPSADPAPTLPALVPAEADSDDSALGALMCVADPLPAPDPTAPSPATTPPSAEHGLRESGAHLAAWLAPASLIVVAGVIVARARRGSVKRAAVPQPSAPRAPRARPRASSALACAVSRKGPVRSRCEDRSCAFTVRGVTVLVVADGMGGHPDGEAAAELAVEAVRRLLPVELRRCGNVASHASLVRLAIAAAARSISEAAASFGYRPEDAALSTTLLILIADPDRYTVGYLGDGGMVVARATGELTVLMEAQKGDRANIVLGSLGPSGIDGTPVVKDVPRHRGDLAVIGTDGVFDRVPAEFARRLRSFVLERRDVATAVEEALDALERVTDEDGPVADDNLTLAAVLTEA